MKIQGNKVLYLMVVLFVASSFSSSMDSQETQTKYLKPGLFSKAVS